MKKTVIFILLAILAVGAAGCTNGKTVEPVSQAYYPAESWRTSAPEEQGMDSGLLADMVSAIQTGGKRVDSITIIRNGYKVNETYFYPYQKGMLHALNSCTKSFVSALTGIAIGEGSIKSADEKVTGYFPELNIANLDERKQKLRIRDLLSMTSGLDWQFTNDASTKEMDKSPNFTKYTLDLPMKEEPGQTFLYANGALHAAAAILMKATGKTPEAYAAEKLEPLGIRDLYWGKSPEGVNRGDAGLFLRPDDMAKLGYLYLNKGKWGGRQLVPERWVEASTRTQAKPDWGDMFPGYGYGWWIPRFGGYTAMGNGSNFIFVLPEYSLVAVFTGGIYVNEDMFYPAELVERFIIPAVKSGTPLPANTTGAAALKQAVQTAGEAPAPQMAGRLPETAKAISGKPFRFEDGTVMTLNFQERSSGFTLELNGKLKVDGGLDGRYRINDTGNALGTLPDHNHMAFKGEWTAADTFRITEQNMEDAFISVYEFRFNGNNIEMKAHSNFNAGTTEGTSRATIVN